jgi:hypothetical protein
MGRKTVGKIINLLSIQLLISYVESFARVMSQVPNGIEKALAELKDR